jgi:hypothetical protein
MKIRSIVRVYTLALMSFAMATFLLINFALIWAYGKLYVYESNHIVLVMETVLMVAILFFSLNCMVEQLRRKD